MNIVWFVNEIMPEVSLMRNDKPSPFGGWLVYASKLVSDLREHQLTIVSPDQSVNQPAEIQGEKIHYILYEKTLNDPSKTKQSIINVFSLIKPDLIHIFGTEHYHSRVVAETCKERSIPFTVSIQGLVSIYAKHYLSGVPGKIQYRLTLRDFLKRDRLIDQQKKFVARGQDELVTLSIADHVIGRTDWDFACSKLIHPGVNYHVCNETLRSHFYEESWTFNQIVKHRIFTSQAYYPIKGFHYLIEAIHMLSKKYPDISVHVAGEDVFSVRSLNDRIKQSSYASYINQLIHQYKLENIITFTGVLSEQEMISEYQASHTFVMPSAIENSPNSVGEAMILGVPTVTSYVGGIRNLVDHGINGYVYQHDAPYMLAHFVDQIWQDDMIAQSLSKHAQEKARQIHDPIRNRDLLIEIYQRIIHS